MSRPGDLARIVRVSGTGKHVNGLERVGNGGNNEGIFGRMELLDDDWAK